MEYETADGSQFSLLEIFANDENGDPIFRYTSVTALVQGEAYAGKIDQRIEDVDDVEALSCIRPVPIDNIHPLFPGVFKRAPSNMASGRYHFKSPTFTYEDSLPHHMFAAHCLLNEAAVLEKLREHPHPNVVKYHGCVVKDGRITQLVLEKYACSIANLDRLTTDPELKKIVDGIRSGMNHLHDLGLAHNDICLENVCIDEQGNAILVDFDSCMPFGETLLKGTTSDGELVSTVSNDLSKLEDLILVLKSKTKSA